MSPIVNFFKNKSVFITGGTGFLGKLIQCWGARLYRWLGTWAGVISYHQESVLAHLVTVIKSVVGLVCYQLWKPMLPVLIEKLLYSCRDINNIFMHIKPKHGKSIDDRMIELFESPAFERIKKDNPAALRKIVPIAGNISDEQLGISNENMTILQDEVSVVFHSAAMVKFNYNLGPSVEINTKGTQKILNICKGMKNLQSFVYLSTAYSNCPRGIIEEDVYETGVSLDKFYEDLKSANIDDFKKLVGSRPNAYIYSKALAEEVIAKNARDYDLPAAIVRPSSVISAVKDPMPGWVENLYGWNSIISGGMRGVLRTVHGDPAFVATIVPVDYVTNLCIAAAWDTHKRWEIRDKRLKVFNCSTGMDDAFTQGDLISDCFRHSQNVVEHVGPKPNLYMTPNRHKFNIALYLMETLPFYCVKFLESITGKKWELLSVYERTRKVSDVLSYFMINEFKFVDTNTKQLYRELDDNDAELFDFNVKNIKWDECLKNYVIGLNNLMGKTK